MTGGIRHAVEAHHELTVEEGGTGLPGVTGGVMLLVGVVDVVLAAAPLQILEAVVGLVLVLVVDLGKVARVGEESDGEDAMSVEDPLLPVHVDGREEVAVLCLEEGEFPLLDPVPAAAQVLPDDDAAIIVYPHREVLVENILVHGYCLR